MSGGGGQPAGGRGASGGRLDLSGLEATLAGLGLPGRTARVVPHERRRGWWFRWDARELRVSEKVIERCAPADAQVLLANAVFQRRRRQAASRRGIGAGAVALAGMVLAGWGLSGAAAILLPLALVLAWGAWVLFELGRARLAADDDTVTHLSGTGGAIGGDSAGGTGGGTGGGTAGAERLVLALNTLDTEELRVGAYRASARPDLHKRAERLVRLHALCAASPGAAAPPDRS